MLFGRAGAALVALTLSAASAQAATPLAMRLVVLDVEGAGGALLVSPEGRTMLIDSGWPQSSQDTAPPSSIEPIRTAMRRLKIDRIDYLLTTHYHNDHMGAVAEVLSQFPVAMVLDHGENREDSPLATPSYATYMAAIKGKPRRIVSAGDHLQLGSVTVTFVTSDGKVLQKPLPGAGARGEHCDAPLPKSPADENVRSIGFVAALGKARLLHLGDLTADVERGLVCPSNKVGKVDVLVVSHHGSDQSNSPALIDSVAPRVALMGNGARKGGSPGTFARLAASPAKPSLWQTHSTANRDVNRPEQYIANVSAPDEHFALDALIERDGTVNVTNTRNGYSERFPPNPG